MSFTYAAMATDLFRVSYQSYDAAYLYEPAQTISDRIAQAMKKHIALLDAFFSFGEYVVAADSAPGLARYNAWLTTPFRIVSIAQGIYHMQTDPNADASTIKQDILLNLLNIGRVAMASLRHSVTNPTTQKFYLAGSLAFTLADLAVRMNALFTNRTAIAEQIKGSYDPGITHVFGKIADGAIDGGSYLLRLLASTCYIGIFYQKGYQFTKSNLSGKSFLELTGWVALSVPLAFVISMSMQKIFNDMGFEPTAKRRVVELVVSHLATAALVGAVAVGLGRAGSLSEIVKPLYPAVLTVALASSIAYLFKIGISQTLNVFGIEAGGWRDLGEWSFSIVTSLVLTALAAAGLGITQSVRASGDLYQRIFFVAIGALSVGIGSTLAATTLLEGVPTWKEFAIWHKIAWPLSLLSLIV